MFITHYIYLFTERKKAANEAALSQLNIDSKRIGLIAWVLNDLTLAFVDYSLRQRE